ncbi:hypothetical protein DDE18_04320 [Nocardioides gansuensis]|uniref:DUF305 domain-containing protein n=2 Tax=Nocardioides gansuensis TaxID=2138300 RepID=A0A2T8FCY4_9ACTN|nr:hypothetical protein DDE18_04320 [Nocardioides gansuensis]
MAQHPGQAVLMSELARQNRDPRVGQLASAIRLNQLVEIAQWQGMFSMWVNAGWAVAIRWNGCTSSPKGTTTTPSRRRMCRRCLAWPVRRSSISCKVFRRGRFCL